MPDLWMDAMHPARLAGAVGLAAELHRDQRRKGTRVPYVSHVLAVAALVAEDEGTEEEVLAALLHDAAEDQGGEAALAQIAERLGAQVAGLVRECSDSVLAAGEPKAPWRERKEAALQRLASRSPGALKIIAADKLHNTRATVADLELVGVSVWARFKTGRDGFLWYHEQMATELVRLSPASRSAALLRTEVDKLTEGPVPPC